MSEKMRTESDEQDDEIPDESLVTQFADSEEPADGQESIYTLRVGRREFTDTETGAETTLWRAEGRFSDTEMDWVSEVSPYLPEAIMGVCESLERRRGGV